MSMIPIMLVAYLIVIFLLLMKYIGKSTVELYSLNRRQTGTALLVLTSLATTIGGGVIIGLIAVGYEAGLIGLFVGLAYALGLLVTAYFAPRIHQYASDNNIFSFPNYLNHRYYGEKKGGFNYLVTLVNMFIFFFLLAAQFVAMALLIKNVFAVHYNVALAISALVVIAYTAVAGLSGVIITDTIQFIFITIVTFALFLPRALALGSGHWHLLPRSYFLGTGYGIVFLVGLFVFFTPSTIVRMEFWQRIIAAKSPKTARRATLLTGFFLLPFYAAFPLIGMAVRAIGTIPSDTASVAYVFINSNFSEHLQGIIFVGLLAALMSSADSFLNLLAVSAVKDLAMFCPRTLWRTAVQSDSFEEWSKANVSVVRVLRWSALFLGLLGLVVAVVLPNLVDLMIVGTSSAVIFTPCTVAAMLKRGKLRAKSAFWSVSLGFLVNVIIFVSSTLKIIEFEPKASFVPAFLVALTAYFVAERVYKHREK